MSKCKVIICDEERTDDNEGYCKEHFEELKKVREHNRRVDEQEKKEREKDND